MCHYGNYSDVQCVPHGEGEMRKSEVEAVSHAYTHIVTLTHTHTHIIHTHAHTHSQAHTICTRTHTHTHTCSVVPATFSHLPTIPVMSFPGWFHRHNLLLRPCPSLRPKECCSMPSSLSRASRRQASSAPLSNDLQVARKQHM